MSIAFASIISLYIFTLRRFININMEKVMIEQELQRKIADFRELGLPPYVAREGNLHLVDHMVSTVIGARRSGICD